jgi:Na+-transporting NADH:ubiquinone oxidoreductase subunit NqrD
VRVLRECQTPVEMPSEADIKVTRDLIRAGQLIGIEVLDHVVIGPSVAGTGAGLLLITRGRVFSVAFDNDE